MSAIHGYGGMGVGPDTEQSTIGNFKGSMGTALISGTVTRTNIKTGEQETLPFTDTDMRFMTGTFMGADAKEYPGTFGFV
jgi:hypothetical protein